MFRQTSWKLPIDKLHGENPIINAIKHYNLTLPYIYLVQLESAEYLLYRQHLQRICVFVCEMGE